MCGQTRLVIKLVCLYYQLMDEFKRVHRKMFAHGTFAEVEGSTCCHSEVMQFKISHSLEVSYTFLYFTR